MENREVLRSFESIRADLGAILNEKITQERMAELLGVSLSTYKRYEKELNKVPTDITVKIADMIGEVDIRKIRYKR